MIKEAYVSFEVAKLLKDKGFDIPCSGRYSVRSKEFHLDCTKMCNNGGLFECAAPTHQMAMKWLREVHNIDIFPWKIGKGIYSCAIFNSNTGQDLSSNKDFPSEKYEETVEVAIKYCLENII